MENWNDKHWRHWKARNEFILLSKLKQKGAVEKDYEEKVLYELFDSLLNLKIINGIWTGAKYNNWK